MTTLMKPMRSLQRPTNRQQGFSLIELMIVVAIIAILAMIALPQYQTFTAKAKLGSALAETSGGKIGVEALIADGVASTSVPAIGLSSSTSRCSKFETVVSTTAESNITCTLKTDSQYSGNLILTRSVEGAWSCAFPGARSDIVPGGCTGKTT